MIIDGHRGAEAAKLAALSDEELAALAVVDKGHALPLLIRRHETSVFRLIRSHVGDADEARDLTQETFVAAYLALRRYDPERPFRAWLATIALNKCRDWARRRAVRRFLTFAAPLDAVALRVAGDAVPADVATDDRMLLERVAAAIPALPVALKEPLILCAIEGHSQAQAADILGISEKAVETRIRRARTALQEKLSRS